MTREMTRGSARNDAVTRDDTILIEAISRARARARTRYQNRPDDASSRVIASSDPAPRDRHHRFRERRKRGVAVYQLELDGEGLDWLVRLGWLDEASASDRSAVGAAVSRMLSDAARR